MQDLKIEPVAFPGLARGGSVGLNGALSSTGPCCKVISDGVFRESLVRMWTADTLLFGGVAMATRF